MEISNDFLIARFDACGSIQSLIYRPTGLEMVSKKTWLPGSKTNPVWLGVGGIGSVSMYAANAKPTAPTWDTFVYEGGPGGVPKSSLCGMKDDLPVASFVYECPPWYRVRKDWVAGWASKLTLYLTWEILKPGWFSEPALHCHFANGGWDTYTKYGTPYDGGPAVETTIPDIQSAPLIGGIAQAWSELNRFFIDWVQMTGPGPGPTVKMIGTHNLQTAMKPAMEQNVMKSGVYFEYGIHWANWWGGNPTPPKRYQTMKPQSWTDHYELEVTP